MKIHSKSEINGIMMLYYRGGRGSRLFVNEGCKVVGLANSVMNAGTVHRGRTYCTSHLLPNRPTV
jgi:hypothetical protein